jgi:V8-like Glu-specific endopeptidase
MKARCFRILAVLAILVLLMVVWAIGLQTATKVAGVGQRQEAGRVFSVDFKSPHPAPGSWNETYIFPGAKFVRLHFSGLNLAPGDKLVVSGPDSSQSWEYTGRGVNGNGDFWSFAIEGDSVQVALSAPSGKSNGFKIVDVGYGTVALNKGTYVPEVVNDTDGREPVACHTNEEVINDAQKPVARLLFTVKRSQYLCTGELIRGNQDNMLITNAHCMDNQTEVSSLEARFNYQYTDCDETEEGIPQSFYGGTFLTTNSERYSTKGKNKGGGLDYTLLTLQDNPEGIYGELIPTTADGFVGQEMNFIQHPAGRPKEIGYWENDDYASRCDIHTVRKTYGSAYPDSQIGYACDSEGGSSGSAITRASDGKVIGLHHYGGVDVDTNSATMMSFICADAGNLLTCDDN